MNYNNWTQLNDPSVPQISGLEFFAGDNVALDIVKYMDSPEWHWMIRIWDANGQCSIEASYDQGGEGYTLMSACFDGILSHLEACYPNLYSQLNPQKTSIVSNLVRKACEIGMAVMISAATIISPIAAPAMAFAADDGGTYVEVADGTIYKYNEQTTIAEAEASGAIVYDADLTSLTNALSDGGVGYNVGSGYITLESDIVGYNSDHILVLLDSGQSLRIYNQEAVDAVANLIGNSVFDFQQELIRVEYLEVDNVPDYVATYLDTGYLNVAAMNNAVAAHSECDRGKTMSTRLALMGGLSIIAVGLFVFAFATEGKLYLKKDGRVVRTITVEEVLNALQSLSFRKQA